MPEWRKNADAFWTQDLALKPGAFDEIQGVYCAAQSLYSGIQLFHRNDFLVLAAPPEMIFSLEEATQGRTPEELFSDRWLQQFCGQRAMRILGPAEVKYADATSFRRVHVEGVRKLSMDDSDAYAALCASLDPEELESSGISADHFPAFGAFAGGVLAAVASYSIWEPAIAHIVVATHPSYRRRGLASAAVGALAEEAFGRSMILQWRALSVNSHSLSMAQRLGFTLYASTLYARLKA